jgi:hypothetical protein
MENTKIWLPGGIQKMQTKEKDFEQGISNQDIPEVQIDTKEEVKITSNSRIDEVILLSERKLFMSGFIALVLWIGTAGVIATHVYVITDFGYKITQVRSGTQTSKEEVDNIQKSIGAVDGTAKGLYSFLTPFAAAVTAFFFNEAYGRKK